MKKRNYLWESLVKSKALFVMSVWIIILTIMTSLDAMSLRLTTQIIQTGNLSDLNVLIGYTIILIVLSGVTAISDVGTSYSYIYLSNIYSEKIITADYSMFMKWSSAEIMTTCNSIWNYSMVIRQMIFILKAVTSIIINLVAICIIDYTIIIPIIVIYIIGGIILKIITTKWIEYDKIFDSVRRKRNSELDDIINGFSEVRAYHTEKNHIDSIREKNKTSLSLLTDRKKIGSSINMIFELLSGSITIIIVLYAVLVMQNNGISVAKTLNIIIFASRLVGPMDTLIDCTSGFSELTATYPKFVEIMDYENSVSDGDIKLFSFNNSIEFKDVSFSYDKSTKIITDLNLKIEKGQKIGICGPTGGGKSTLLRLIPKYYDPDSGTILIDSIDSKKYDTKSIRQHIGTIHQDPYIFNDTIMNNVLYANKSATYDDVVNACKKASIYEFILSLEDKFDTQVGPRGLKLSGGQKQRLALARLILKNPDIIILDEATSALDNETEKVIQESLSMFNDKTQIVVAHRLSTIKDSDKIIVVDNHKIIEEGTHNQLMKLDKVYAKMYNTGIQ